MRITSPEFRDGGPIPRRYTCDGEDVSPPLTIDDVPENAASLVLVVDDPDAPHGTFVHWLIWDMPPSTGAVQAAIDTSSGASTLGNASQGTNDFGRPGYSGPCPPRGTHTYRFLLYALARRLDLPPGSTRAELDRAMTPAVIAQAALRGTYVREHS